MELAVVVAMMAVASATTATLVYYGTRKATVPPSHEIMDQVREVLKPEPKKPVVEIPQTGKLDLFSTASASVIRLFQTSDASRVAPTIAGAGSILFDGTLQLVPGANGRVEFRDSWGAVPKFSFNTVTGNLDVPGGDITVAGTITAMSDRRVKTDIEPIYDALKKVLKLEGVTYFMKSDTAKLRPMMGMIAQDVQEVVPELVQENENGFLSLAYGNSTALLVEAVKELNKENKKLYSELEELKIQQAKLQRILQQNGIQ